jgi:hypothetical protein
MGWRAGKLILQVPAFSHQDFSLTGVPAMPQGKEVLLGLNMTGVIVAIVFLVTGLWCLIWIPWVVDSMKSDPNYKGD